VELLPLFSASTTGLVQNDLKRVVAYSTCSQLGYYGIFSQDLILEVAIW
jgi:NADH:ubiquinone oxidoreductase subunit 5 (subunit L)/multisubunit Na+/H+ antiporter MnhA subunit